jgi:hypothetical protein
MKKIIYIAIPAILFCFNVQGQVSDLHNWDIPIKDNIVIPGYLVDLELFSFREKMAVVKDLSTNKYGFVDIYGEIVIPSMYNFVRGFKDGRAAVFDSETKKWGFINYKNETVIPFIYDFVSDFGYDKDDFPGFKGLAYVNIGISDDRIGSMITDGKWGLINTDGEVILPIKYGDISQAIENMASIVDGERVDTPRPDGAYSWEVIGKMGFINREGKIVIPVEYDYDFEARFQDGYITLKKDGIEFQFDIKGEIVSSKETK